MYFEKGDGSVILDLMLGQCGFGYENHDGVFKGFWEVTYEET